MKRALFLAALAAVACDDVTDRGDCSASTDCPQGEYCASTPDGKVCWPDATGPTLAVGSAGCTGGCKRDGTLEVTATAEVVFGIR